MRVHRPSHAGFAGSVRRAGVLRRVADCRETSELIQPYLDGLLDRRTARLVIAHLDRCADCADERDVYRCIKESLARMSLREGRSRLRGRGIPMADLLGSPLRVTPAGSEP